MGFYPMLYALINALPTVNASNGFVDGMTLATQYLSTINQFLPMGSLIAILLFDVTFETGYLTFKIIYWFIRRFPTQS